MIRHCFRKIFPFKRIAFLCRAFRRSDRCSGFDYRRTNYFTINYKCKRMVIATVFNIDSFDHNVLSGHCEVHSLPFREYVTLFLGSLGSNDFSTKL